MSRKPRRTKDAEPGITMPPAVIHVSTTAPDEELQRRLSAMQTARSTSRAVMVDSDDQTPPIDPEILAIMLEPEAGENGIEFEIAEVPRIRTGHYGDDLLFNYWRDHDDAVQFADSPEQAARDRHEYMTEAAA